LSLSPIVVGIHFYDLNYEAIRLYSINDSVLLVEPRRSIPLPVSSKRFVSEASDPSEAQRARQPDNILPFFITLEYIFRQLL